MKKMTYDEIIEEIHDYFDPQIVWVFGDDVYVTRDQSYAYSRESQMAYESGNEMYLLPEEWVYAGYLIKKKGTWSFVS